MADNELNIVSSFDASPIIDGMQEAASATETAASQMAASFQAAGTAEASFSEELDKLLEPLIATSSTLEGVTVPATTAFSSALDALLEPLIAAQEATQALTPAELAFSDALDASLAGITGQSAALEGASSAELAFSEALDSALGPLTAADTAIAAMDDTLAVMATGMFDATAASTQFAEAQQAVVGPLTETDAALAEMAEAQGAATAEQQAAAEAQAQYAASMDAVLAEMAAAQTVATESAASISQYAITTNEAAGANAALDEAVQTLNSELQGGVANLEAIATASEQVAAAAQKAGFQVVQTAEGMQILAAAEKNVVVSSEATTAALGETGGMLAYVSGRALALEAGVGSLGFGLGILGRSSSVLGPILVAAFPVIGAILLAEVVSTLIDKFENLQLEIIKATRQIDDLASSEMQSANAAEVQNLKLEDQIQKLEGRPVENRLAEAATEAKERVDQLNKSLGDALEKELQLLEQGEIGLFKGILTGKEETSDVKGKLQPLLEAYLDAVSKRQEANQELELSDTEANQKAVALAQDQVNKKKTALDQELKNVQDSIEKQKALQEASGPIPGAKGAGAVGKPAEEVEAAFRPLEAQVRGIKDVENAYELRNKRIEEGNKLLQGAAGAANLKDETTELLKQHEIQAKILDLKTKASGETQVAVVRARGGNAEAIAQAEQAAERARYAQQRENLQGQLEIVSGNLAEYKAVLGQLAIAAQEHNNRMEEIENRRIEGLQKENEAQIKALEEANRDFEKEMAKRAAILSKTQAPENRLEAAVVGQIQLKSIEDVTRAQERMFAEGRSNRREELNQLQATIAALQAARAAEEAKVSAQIAGLRAQQTQVLGVPTVTTPQDLALQQQIDTLTKELTTSQEQYKAAIDQTTESWIKLDTSSTNYFTKLKNESNDFMDSFQLGWQNSLNQLNSGFASAVDKWISYGNTFRDNFGRSMANLAVKILEDFTNVFIQIGLKAAEAATFKGLEKLFNINQPLTPGPGPAGLLSSAPAVAPPGVAGVTGQGLFGTAQTSATSADTAALTAHTTALGAGTAAQTAQVPAVTASTIAHATNTPAVTAGTIAHAIHAPTVDADTSSSLLHTIGVNLDTAATQVAAAVKAAFSFIGLAGGGLVQGAGTATSDSIPAMLSHGEFVVSAAAVSRPGTVDFLHKLNAGNLQLADHKFAYGGFVGGGLVIPSSGFGHLGGGANISSTSNTDNRSVANIRLQYAPQFGSSFSADEHLPAIYDGLRSMFRRAGFDV
jgi:hypothetical protein